jgi:hypothetical protein
VNDLIIRCAGLALRDVPEMNATFDAKTGIRKLNPTVDVSVAVATPGGLITPIVTNVDQRGLVSDSYASCLFTRARLKKSCRVCVVCATERQREEGWRMMAGPFPYFPPTVLHVFYSPLPFFFFLFYFFVSS